MNLMENDEYNICIQLLCKQTLDSLHGKQLLNDAKMLELIAQRDKYARLIEQGRDWNAAYVRTTKIIDSLKELISVYADAIKVKTELSQPIIKQVHYSEVTSESPLEISYDPLESCESPVNSRCFSSELQAVPYMQQCVLLGGARKKKEYMRKGKPQTVRKRKPKQTGPYITPSNKKNDRTKTKEVVYLEYKDPDTLINAAAPFQIITYQFTSAYDVSSGILTTAYSGFEEWIAFYDYNRVRLTEVDWSVANNEATVGVRVGMIPTCFDANANILTYQGAIDLMEGAYSTDLVMLGRANGGGDTHHFKYTIIPEQILGDKEYHTSQLWRGTYNSSPTNMLYLNLVVISVGSGTNLTNGVTGNLALRSKVEFWFRRNIIDPQPHEPLVKPPEKKRLKEKKNDSSDEELVVVTTRKRDRPKI